MNTADHRLSALHSWLSKELSGQSFELAPASADASFRRYFRATLADGSTRIAMDAPPEHENCQPFVHVAGLLAEAGVHAPTVLAKDLGNGFLLLTDLGRQTYLDVINNDNSDELMRPAIDSLIKWQLVSRENELPPYDEALLRREIGLFQEWYLGRHLGITLTDAQNKVIDDAFTLIIRNNLAELRVFVHRDYMPRNLMVSEPLPGVLDFQDAVYGPISYDIASLCRDAFISWEEEHVIDWTVRYWEKARKAGLPVEDDFGAFWRNVEWMGLQRHLKILGIFCRLNYRDGKEKYLTDLPRFSHYVRATCNRYRALGPFLKLLDELEGVDHKAGYTF